MTATIHQPSLWDLQRHSLAYRYAVWRDSADGQVVYEEARSRALLLVQRGLRHYGIAPIVEAIRYDRSVIVGKDAEGFRCNNSFRALLARELMERNEVLRGFFDTRRRLSP